MGITLSKKHGVNPCLTVCPRCGKDSPELLLLGNTKEYICKGCGGKIIGKYPKGKCPHCGYRTAFSLVGEFDGMHKKLPASDLCDICKAEIKMLEEEIAKGGVPWRCSDCKSEGVIKHNAEFSIDFRKQYPVEGFTFSKDNCPVCSSNYNEKDE